MNQKNQILDKNYKHFNDYAFKSILQKRANGLLKFVEIPYQIDRMMISEYANLEPNISRMDFVGEAKYGDRTVSLILECQTNLPTEDDVKRFFQYISSLRVFKDNNVDLYILCTKKSSRDEIEFEIRQDCIYTMHIISLKDFKATDIFNNIENKLKNNDGITDEDIASLQLIIYTEFEESKLEILNRARKLLDEISERLVFDINEKVAIIYLFDLLSANMLSEDEHEQYMEVNTMLVNPRDRYFKNKGIEEGKAEGIDKGKLEVAVNLINSGFGIDEVVELTGLDKNVILNGK